MEDRTTNPTANRAIFSSGDQSFTVRDLIDAAIFRGELEPLWQEFLRLVGATRLAEERGLETDDGAIDEASVTFRYRYDLITAEETEQWLAQRGLTLADFSTYFVQHYWADLLGDEVKAEPIDYATAPTELRDLFVVELTLSGELDRQAARLSWRVASVAGEGNTAPALDADRTLFLQRHQVEESQTDAWLKRVGRDAAWLEQSLLMEATLRQKFDALLSDTARSREIGTLRLPLTRFDVETIEFDTADAAREALLCVRDDDMSMEEVAAEGRYPYRRSDLLLEDVPEELQQPFLSVLPGAVIGPIPHEEAFHLCRILGKAEPNLNDPVVKTRADNRILDRHFAELTAKHIQWRNLVPAES